MKISQEHIISFTLGDSTFRFLMIIIICKFNFVGCMNILIDRHGNSIMVITWLCDYRYHLLPNMKFCKTILIYIPCYPINIIRRLYHLLPNMKFYKSLFIFNQYAKVNDVVDEISLFQVFSTLLSFVFNFRNLISTHFLQLIIL